MIVTSKKPLQIGCVAKLKYKGVMGDTLYTHFQGEVIGIKKNMVVLKSMKKTFGGKSSQYKVKNKFIESRHSVNDLQRIETVRDNWFTRLWYGSRIISPTRW